MVRWKWSKFLSQKNIPICKKSRDNLMTKPGGLKQCVSRDWCHPKCTWHPQKFMPEPWLFCISICVIYVILSHLIPILRPECLTCAGERFGRSKKRSNPRASCSNFARIIFQSLGFYTSFAELWSLKDLSISIFEHRKKKVAVSYQQLPYVPYGFLVSYGGFHKWEKP